MLKLRSRAQGAENPASSVSSQEPGITIHVKPTCEARQNIAAVAFLGQRRAIWWAVWPRSSRPSIRLLDSKSEHVFMVIYGCQFLNDRAGMGSTCILGYAQASYDLAEFGPEIGGQDGSGCEGVARQRGAEQFILRRIAARAAVWHRGFSCCPLGRWTASAQMACATWLLFASGVSKRCRFWYMSYQTS